MSDDSEPRSDNERVLHREALLALYQVVRANTAALGAINYDAFAKHAEKVGLHYDPRFGLMRQEEWDLLQPFLSEGTAPNDESGPRAVVADSAKTSPPGPVRLHPEREILEVMGDNLVQALARRLWEACSETTDAGGSQLDSDAVARECQRQMEWTRAQALEQVAGARGDAPRWAYETHINIRDAALTMAPEDWQP